MKKYTKGFTLLEVVIAIIMFVLLAVTVIFVFRAALLSWTFQDDRTGIRVKVHRGIDELFRDLREAKNIQSTTSYDEIRFSGDGSNYSIYYFYNSNDVYTPPPAFNQTTYELKKTNLTGGVNGTFNYGDGQMILAEVLSPITSDLSVNGSVVNIDLSVKHHDETIRRVTQVIPRNLDE